LVLLFLYFEEMTILKCSDMYLIVFVIISQCLVITLLIHRAIIAVTVTDSGDRN
jgi:hypothetical protein